MDREIVLLALAALLIGTSVPMGALSVRVVSPDADSSRSGASLERMAIVRLLLPLIPALLAAAALLGWALVEPEDSEPVPWWMFLASIPVLLVWARTAMRAARALRPPSVRSAATVGLLRPRVVVSDDFGAMLDLPALAAARAHEHAHARHRDPLRIWLAQIATDLQWPLPGAKARFDRWQFALELARDEEARATVDGADLAAAVLAAVRVEQLSAAAVASIAPTGAVLRRRLERLLEPLPKSRGPGTRHVEFILLPALVVVAAMMGAGFGEVAVQQIFAWGR